MPRLAFINKLDRQGANPYRVVKDLRTKLKLNAALLQVPIGLEEKHAGVVDVITRKGFVFEGARARRAEVGRTAGRRRGTKARRQPQQPTQGGRARV